MRVQRIALTLTLPTLTLFERLAENLHRETASGDVKESGLVSR